MMRNSLKMALVGAAMAASAPLLAQEAAPAPTPAPAPAPAPAPNSPADPAQPGMPPAATEQYTDADLKAFARAAIEASKIQQDATVPAEEKQPKMLAAVQAQGLDPVKFNEIAQASQANPTLRQRIQQVASAEAQPGAQPQN